MFDATIELKNILTNTCLLDKYPKDQWEEIINKNCEALEYILSQNMSPDFRFPFLNSGAFKEAYTLIGAPDIVIKFFTAENETSREEDVLNDAEEYGVDDLFVKTWFIYFDSNIKLPSGYIKNDDCSHFETEREDSKGNLYWTTTTNPDYYEPELVGFEVQQRCSPFKECRSKKDSKFFKWLTKEEFEESDPIYLKDFQIKDYTFYREMCKTISAVEWWEKVYQYYGIDMISKFLSFSKFRSLCDLHLGNIGYYKTKDGIEIPIILDWLSN